MTASRPWRSSIAFSSSLSGYPSTLAPHLKVLRHTAKYYENLNKIEFRFLAQEKNAKESTVCLAEVGMNVAISRRQRH
jgi:hypothetical protein